MWSKASEGVLDPKWVLKDHNYDSDLKKFSIHAALYAASAGFGLQNWNLPANTDLGTLYVYGSIAQRFRGVVGYYDDQAGRLFSGYHKYYKYNESLAKNSPLLFSPITNASWVVGWIERADPPQGIKE
jgi:hypothetical protein